MESIAADHLNIMRTEFKVRAAVLTLYIQQVGPADAEGAEARGRASGPSIFGAG